ncbi:hypothetical protein, partial [Rhodopseudomonas palustris]|uniref:hypothetical protein n=1 Tax=Rhodopseudomonas palustris TaxID=1076 RepID=UPI001AEBC8F9
DQMRAGEGGHFSTYRRLLVNFFTIERVAMAVKVLFRMIKCHPKRTPLARRVTPDQAKPPWLNMRRKTLSRRKNTPRTVAKSLDWGKINRVLA